MKTKTGLQKLMDWHSSAVTNDLYEHEMFYDKARTLLAEEQAQKPTADSGLVEELHQWSDHTPRFASLEDSVEFQRICSRYKPVEPLAVLADRKNREVAWIGRSKFNDRQWSIEIQEPYKTEVVYGNTYAEAELNCREWLEKQEDK